LLRIHYDWVQAGEVTQRTISRLSEQLRRYLDDKAWLDNRRIMQLMREIEQSALALRDRMPEGVVSELDETAPEINLTMDRPLFNPPLRSQIDEIPQDAVETAPTDALFGQIYVDKARLAALVRKELQTRHQVSLAEMIAAYPLKHGLAELVAYSHVRTTLWVAREALDHSIPDPRSSSLDRGAFGHRSSRRRIRLFDAARTADIYHGK
jgi:hypothetical protein